MKSLLEKFNIKTDNEYLYDIAFTHSSYKSSSNLTQDYERLEFLGDTILNMVVSDYLFNKYPFYNEGKLTKIRSNYVCQSALIFYSTYIGLNDYAKFDLNKNFTQSEIYSINGDTFESFIGAIFIDKGFEFTQKFIANNIFQFIDDEKVFFYDYKSEIKEYADINGLTIKYEIFKEEGVPHDMIFVIGIYINNKLYGVGEGKNKKKAQQDAACKAIKKLESEGFDEGQ